MNPNFITCSFGRAVYILYVCVDKTLTGFARSSAETKLFTEQLWTNVIFYEDEQNWVDVVFLIYRKWNK